MRRLLICVYAFLLIAEANTEKLKPPGSPFEKDPNDPEVMNYLVKAVAQQNESTNDEEVTVTKITKVTAQVVAGMIYSYDFEGEGVNSKKRRNCHAELFVQVWTSPEPEIKSFNCS